ncbi:MAG: hypothetical protein ACI965_001643 [Paraglaciecola sp.]|jgi:hypothetical protein
MSLRSVTPLFFEKSKGMSPYFIPFLLQCRQPMDIIGWITDKITANKY